MLYHTNSKRGEEMKKLNLSTRIELFAVCTSIEHDLKKFILASTSQLNFTSDMICKAKNRKKNIKDNQEDILNLNCK